MGVLFCIVWNPTGDLSQWVPNCSCVVCQWLPGVQGQHTLSHSPRLVSIWWVGLWFCKLFKKWGGGMQGESRSKGSMRMETTWIPQPPRPVCVALRGIRGQHLSLDTGLQGCAGQGEASQGELVSSAHKGARAHQEARWFVVFCV